MPDFKTKILKIAAGTVVGTALVVGYLWSMLGGVFLILPIWVLIGLFVLFWVSVLAAGLKAGYKGIVAVMASFVLEWFGFNALYKHTCGPNAKDVKVMKPMAEKISAYIVKHGIPERLEEIPDLPYRLEGCERKVTFKKRLTVKTIDVNESKNATYKSILEKCKYTSQDRTYEVRIIFEYYYENKIFGGSLYLNNWESETGIRYAFNSTNPKILDNTPHFYSGKSTGICNPMRQ